MYIVRDLHRQSQSHPPCSRVAVPRVTHPAGSGEDEHEVASDEARARGAKAKARPCAGVGARARRAQVSDNNYSDK
jgi:hypothetical protein